MTFVSKPRSILLIGGGLGGLAFARFLKLRDPSIKVTICERDASATDRPQGWVIGLNDDGIKCLSSLNLPNFFDVLTYNGLHMFTMTDSQYNPVMEIGSKTTPLRIEDIKLSIINRWTLHNMLEEGLDIQYGKRFARYEEMEDGVIAHFEDGSQESADILIGADGAKSRVRAQYSDDLKLTYVGERSASGFIPYPDDPSWIPKIDKIAHRSAIRVLSTGGNALLYMRYKDDTGKPHLLWSLSQPAEFSESSDLSRSRLIEIARSCSDSEFEEVVSRTPDCNFFNSTPMMSMAPRSTAPRTTATRVTLLGDAAHAMTTQRGLGANTAFQDAFDLAVAVTSHENCHDAIKSYESVMFKRGFKNVSASLQSTNMLHLDGWRASMRNGFIKVIGTVAKLVS